MMKSPAVAGSRLFVQIVLPLVIMSVAVGVIATIVAGYFFDDLASQWASQIAQDSTARVVSYFETHARQVERGARVVASDSAVLRAIETNDMSALRATVVAANTNMGFDVLFVLEPSGAVLATTGSSDLRSGTLPFWGRETLDDQGPRTVFTRLGSHETLMAIYPLASTGGYRVAVGTFIDDGFMESAEIGRDDAFGFYDRSGRNAALGLGSDVDSSEQKLLVPSMVDPGPEVKALLSLLGDGGTAFASVREPDREYQLHARVIDLGSEMDLEAIGYVVGAIDQWVPAQAGETARNLVALWSVIAVIALVGLGGLTARRVSRPLVELSEGARRVADGDFSTKVQGSSTREVADLALSFNDMTDSLRERSESLTKKVLELATLYEMSRALGSTLDMDELLGSVLDSALRIFDLDLGYVVLRDLESGVLTVRALKGADHSADDNALRSSMSEWVVREGRPLIFNPDSDSAHQQVDAVTGAKAALCVPLVASDATVGSITVGSSDAAYRFNSEDVRLLSTIANHVTIAIGNIELFLSLQEAYLATVRSLAAAVDAKDSYTRGHSDHVASFAMLIAEKMDLAHEQKVALEMAAYLHDIGKIGVPEDILLKPGALDAEETMQMRHHPLIGANILRPVAFPWAITPIVRHHHECWDGTGYPAGLEGEEIPLLARILSVADSYEAMTADRPYRQGRTDGEATAELQDCAGTQFDPRIVGLFIEALLEEDAVEQDVLGSTGMVGPEEVRAILTVIVDGVLSSFSRLGGPRLGHNVEVEFDAYLAAESLPFRVKVGRLAFEDDFSVDPACELEQMKSALRQLETIIGRFSGQTLVEHFYEDAVGELSGRMRVLAQSLGLTGKTVV